MERTYFAELKMTIDVPKPEFEFLVECCHHHYDGTIKSLIEVGGFMYGAMGRRKFAEEHAATRPANRWDTQLELSFRQFDYLCKAIEFSDTEMGWELRKTFAKCIKEFERLSLMINSRLSKLQFS